MGLTIRNGGREHPEMLIHSSGHLSKYVNSSQPLSDFLIIKVILLSRNRADIWLIRKGACGQMFIISDTSCKSALTPSGVLSHKAASCHKRLSGPVNLSQPPPINPADGKILTCRGGEPLCTVKPHAQFDPAEITRSAVLAKESRQGTRDRTS